MQTSPAFDDDDEATPRDRGPTGDPDQALRQFVRAASHDLYEPIRKARTFLGLLREEHGEALGADGQFYLGRIEDATGRAAALLDALMRYAQVLTQERAFAPVALDAVVDEARQRLAEQIERSGARLEVGPLPAVLGDAGQLADLVTALLDNALVYHRPGSAPVVHIRARVEDGAVRLEIADEGIGIRPAEREAIFEPFRRLHARHEYPGLGMGLALARRIAERHRGTLHVESAPGGPTCFVLSLPALRA